MVSESCILIGQDHVSDLTLVFEMELDGNLDNPKTLSGSFKKCWYG